MRYSFKVFTKRKRVYTRSTLVTISVCVCTIDAGHAFVREERHKGVVAAWLLLCTEERVYFKINRSRFLLIKCQYLHTEGFISFVGPFLILADVQCLNAIGCTQ